MDFQSSDTKFLRYFKDLFSAAVSAIMAVCLDCNNQYSQLKEDIVGVRSVCEN